jgi:hypothetical protein
VNKKGVVLEIILLGRVQGYFFPLASRKNTVRPVAPNSTVVIIKEIKIFKFNIGSSVPVWSTVVLVLLTFFRAEEGEMPYL